MIMGADISIIIVNYNTGDLLLNCLRSICANVKINYEVVVADNASSDGSFDKCIAEFSQDSRYLFFCFLANLGFAKANNMAADRATGRIFHFLNPDTEVPAGMDTDYGKVMDSPDAVYINPLVNGDGSLENAGMPFPTVKNMFLWYFNRKKAGLWFRGASLIVSRDNFEKAGRWCEDYFMYAEDLDFFYNIHLNSVPVKYLQCRIFHLGGGSSSKRWTGSEREAAVEASNRIFYAKHFTHREYILIKVYFLFHYIFRHPSRVLPYVKAWISVSRD